MSVFRFPKPICIFLWVHLFLITSVAVGAVTPQPILKVFRPAGAKPYMNISVYKKYDNIQIPYARARVTVTGPENLSLEIMTDLMGNARLNPDEVIAGLKVRPEQLTLTLSVRLGGQLASQKIALSLEELEFYFKHAAEVLIDEGNQLARAGQLREALKKYMNAHSFDPASVRAVYNAALACEKLGMKYLAASLYSDYLLGYGSEAQDRLTVKKKAIRIAKDLSPRPLIPVRALDLMRDASKALKKRTYLQAVYLYEEAQSLAPWWSEPYYAEGMVFEHLTYQNSFHYSQSAVRNFKLFLEAADPEDPRISEVKDKIEEIERIKKGFDAPKQIPVK